MCQNIQNMSLTNWVHIEILGPHGSTYKPQQPHDNITTTSQLQSIQHHQTQQHNLITYLENKKDLKRIP
jgi:hypothetical protein